MDGFAEFARKLRERHVPHSDTWWGYDSVLIKDPDGNELLVPVMRAEDAGLT